MNTIVSDPSWAPQRPKGHFGRALLIGAVLEVVLVGGLILGSSNAPPPKPMVKKIIAIHMVQPAPPKPKPVPPPPKPVVHPKPVPKPLPHPIPQPKPVVQHVPAPKPLMAKTPLPTAPVVPPSPPVTTPPPPPPPPPPAPSMAAREAAVDQYAGIVRARVQADAHVPEAVRLMHLSGTAVITFRLTPSGQLLWAKIAQSSGVGPIDKAALKSVEEGAYPPFTKNMPKHASNFNVEVHLSSHSS
ncbi:Putative TonB family protein [Acidithiobacillus ferrivorans]|uniref:TonB family protein n=1 Tax=Acidithiobacillus ferrivorans TaxID=160808 RepID=A0A060US88_9PROT|nr:TonB family protein [Acidithiobacillus ferrivorans]CDQ11181.1 TonB family protein [Acidithiobacillus ferrivorans]SMH67541.1 Putative TonB family protein [Acidithiobacillus ferrivorans]